MATKYNACNLGQGFPNFPPPAFVIQAIETVFKDNSRHILNQYTRSGGHQRLVQTLSQVFSPLFGRQIDPNTEIVISVGASEGIFAAIVALVNPGDEVIMIEPYFDIYEGAVIMAGGIMKFVPLLPKSKNNEPSTPQSAADWVLDEEELKKQLSPKTKLLILNTPHNPTGKVFTKEELQKISSIVSQYPQLIVISDEVYEWMVFDDSKHERFFIFLLFNLQNYVSFFFVDLVLCLECLKEL